MIYYFIKNTQILLKYYDKYDKIYNHYDHSYPSHLGKKVIDILKRLKEENRLEQSENCFNKEKVEDGNQALNVFIEWISV